MKVQQVPEKMFNITSHKLKANENHNEISLHACQNGNHQKYSKLKNASVDVRKEKPSVGEIIN